MPYVICLVKYEMPYVICLVKYDMPYVICLVKYDIPYVICLVRYGAALQWAVKVSQYVAVASVPNKRLLFSL